MAMMTTGKQFVKVPLKPFSAVCWAHDFEWEFILMGRGLGLFRLGI